MSAYFIISYDIENMEVFNNYPARVWDIVQKNGGQILVSDTQAIALEGESKMMHSIIKFPTKEIALACFESPEYQEAKVFRHNSTKNTTVVLVEEFVPSN